MPVKIGPAWLALSYNIQRETRRVWVLKKGGCSCREGREHSDIWERKRKGIIVVKQWAPSHTLTGTHCSFFWIARSLAVSRPDYGDLVVVCVCSTWRQSSPYCLYVRECLHEWLRDFPQQASVRNMLSFSGDSDFFLHRRRLLLPVSFLSFHPFISHHSSSSPSV